MNLRVINIIKLCVGAQNVVDLYNWQKNRTFNFKNNKEPVTFIITRMRPRKEQELLNGGSIYWVFKGLILARQKIIALDDFKSEDNISRCKIILDTKIILTEALHKKSFQGWRYFKQEEIPKDKEIFTNEKILLPLKLQKKLSEFGVF